MVDAKDAAGGRWGWGRRRKRKPKNRNYVRGRAREYRVIRRLLKEGAVWVVRSYASHGPIDVTAVFPDRVRLIQVKKGYLPAAERRRLEGLAMSFAAENIQVEVWTSKNGRFQIEVIKPPIPQPSMAEKRMHRTKKQ